MCSHKVFLTRSFESALRRHKRSLKRDIEKRGGQSLTAHEYNFDCVKSSSQTANRRTRRVKKSVQWVKRLLPNVTGWFWPPLCMSWQLHWGCWITDHFVHAYFNTPTTLLLLSTRLYLNINPLPVSSCLHNPFLRWGQSVVFCGASAAFDLHFKAAWSLNSTGWPFCMACTRKMSSCGLKSRPDWHLLRSRPGSCSLKSVILWHKPLIQTKWRAVVVFVATASPGICSLPLPLIRAKSHSDANQLINICFPVALAAKWAEQFIM